MVRLERHPILEFKKGKRVTIYFDGRPVEAYEGETVAAALYASGLRIFSRSFRFHRPRGFFCAIGKCSSCMMEVDGIPNVRTCKVYVRDGMQIRSQNSFPNVNTDFYEIFDRLDSLFPHGFHYKKFIKPSFMRPFFVNSLRKFTGLGNFPKEELGEEAYKKEIECDIAIIGAGPAGLSAAIYAGELGADICLIDENPRVGGQLIKQTHRFFGSAEHGAGTRGIKIAEQLEEEIKRYENVNLMLRTGVFGIYNGVVGAVRDNTLLKIKPKKIIIATGAYERTLIFENNDLPGVYGAGGVQTLMNVYGVRPGDTGLVVGSGNVGLILTYQLLQAGVNVAAIIEAMPVIGGYFVHAAKVRRLGVPIYTRHTIKRAYGSKTVEGAQIIALDDKWQEIPGSGRDIECDFICISVGLSPTHELLYQAGCEMKFVPNLGGFVPVRDKYMETTKKGIYVAGDVAGIEEASTAMIEGRISGLDSAIKLGYGDEKAKEMREKMVMELEDMRSGPFGIRILEGLKHVVV
jgi:sarcosine oxidase subunit alpha